MVNHLYKQPMCLAAVWRDLVSSYKNIRGLQNARNNEECYV